MKNKQSRLNGLTEPEQKKLVDQIVDVVTGPMRSRTEEVLVESPDDYGGDDLHEIRWQICAAVADDLKHGLGDEIERLLKHALDEHAAKNE